MSGQRGPATPTRIVGNDETRFWSYVDRVSAAPCWLWTGYRDEQGYGHFRVGDRSPAAHIYAWKLSGHVVSPIQGVLHLDHTCHDPAECAGGRACLHRACVNLAHLLLSTAAENNERSHSPTAINAAKTHCPAGHEYDEANTYWRPDRSGRHCRQCKRDFDRRASRVRRAREAAEEGRKLLPYTGDRTHCPAGHEYTPENTYVLPTGGRVCRQCKRDRERQRRLRKRVA